MPCSANFASARSIVRSARRSACTTMITAPFRWRASAIRGETFARTPCRRRGEQSPRLVDDDHGIRMTRRGHGGVVIAVPGSMPGSRTATAWPRRRSRGPRRRAPATTCRSRRARRRRAAVWCRGERGMAASLPGPTEERVGIVALVPRQALVRAILGDRRWTDRRDEAFVLAQDRRVQLGELGAGLHAELVDQRVPGAGVRARGGGRRLGGRCGRERSASNAAAVLAQRRLRHPGLGQTDEVVVLDRGARDSPISPSSAGLAVAFTAEPPRRRPATRRPRGRSKERRATGPGALAKATVAPTVLVVRPCGRVALPPRRTTRNGGHPAVVRHRQAIPARRGARSRRSRIVAGDAGRTLSARPWPRVDGGGRSPRQHRSAKRLGGDSVSPGRTAKARRPRGRRRLQRHFVAVDVQRAEQVEAHAGSVRTGTTGAMSEDRDTAVIPGAPDR